MAVFNTREMMADDSSPIPESELRWCGVPVGFVAILGFGRACSDLNRTLAHAAGAELAKQDLGVAAGNLTATFKSAFAGARQQQGASLAIVEEKLRDLDHDLCDEFIVVPDVATKHKKLAEFCLGAIMIGGGPGTANVAAKFLELSKPVVAIEGTGGIVAGNLNPSVMLTKSIEVAVATFTKSPQYGGAEREAAQKAREPITRKSSTKSADLQEPPHKVLI